MANEERSTESGSQEDTTSYDLAELTESRESSDFGGKVYSVVTYLIAAVVGGIILSSISADIFLTLNPPEETTFTGQPAYSEGQGVLLLSIYAGSGIFGALVGLGITYKAIQTYAVKRKYVILSAICSLVVVFVLGRILSMLI